MGFDRHMHVAFESLHDAVMELKVHEITHFSGRDLICDSRYTVITT